MCQELKVIVPYNQSLFILSYRTSQGRAGREGKQRPTEPSIYSWCWCALGAGRILTQASCKTQGSPWLLTLLLSKLAECSAPDWVPPPHSVSSHFPPVPPQINYLHFLKVLCVWYVVYIWFLHAELSCKPPASFLSHPCDHAPCAFWFISSNYHIVVGDTEGLPYIHVEWMSKEMQEFTETLVVEVLGVWNISKYIMRSSRNKSHSKAGFTKRLVNRNNDSVGSERQSKHNLWGLLLLLNLLFGYFQLKPVRIHPCFTLCFIFCYESFLFCVGWYFGCLYYKQ